MKDLELVRNGTLTPGELADLWMLEAEFRRSPLERLCRFVVYFLGAMLSP